MIVYDLECRSEGHRFEGWFKSSEDFARQQERGLVACPFCGSGDVAKAPQAARLARKGNQKPEPSRPAARCTVGKMLATDLGLFEVTAEGFKLVENAPGWSPEDIQELTEAKLIIAGDLREIRLRQ